ncbi:LysR substrate-binding domain-containing protein [Brenneria tiliae]|uniref:LysR substrate-binding domain-containing protein n=1 Tax=Brenneria tiliae TaxID=2914984 RepID=A0ABT0MXE7_9GAMM|nr:LysR substrate-binding domain-containing protein [Brenneria tiliae]MCL2894518.1 LysR substrate-binding domain-containing protein [Brenneria tiliae]
MGKGLDIDVLRTFHAVARFGRFKDAAAYVHRSASAVTTQIQKLEEKVGQQLFVRSNQFVELTQAGRRLLGEATHFLMAHDRLLATLSPRLMSGKVRLGIPDGYAEKFMTDFLPLFVASNPQLELEVEARSSGELLELFSRQQLDLTLAVSREDLAQGEKLCSTQPRWAAAPGFTRDAALPLPIALQLKGCPYREIALSTLKAQGINYRILLESANWQAVLACMRSGLAVGISEFLDAEDASLAFVQGLDMPSLPEHQVYLLTDTSHHAALHLHDMLKSTFQIEGGSLAARSAASLVRID